jgi:hypothetical protein
MKLTKAAIVHRYRHTELIAAIRAERRAETAFHQHTGGQSYERGRVLVTVAAKRVRRAWRRYSQTVER